MDDDTQHPPMNGNDELAKALDGNLQFEETPAPGDEASKDAPTLTPSAQMGDPLATMPLPPLPGDDKPQDDAGTPDPDLPSVHHTHDAGDRVEGTDHEEHHEAKPEEKPEEEKHDEPILPPPLADDKTDDDMGPKSTGDPALDKIKNSALEELKPLVGKLNLAPEEKFDTLLLIIRSTDDHGLLDEAHAAAKDITDETKRAQALLDIVKEVDYFSTKR